MKKVHFGANFTVFVLFFGIALLEAFQRHEWLIGLFWMIAALLFLRADSIRKEK